MTDFKVLISGGGVAGAALAHWMSRLSKANIDVSITLIERSPQKRTSGHQIDLRGPGVKIMKKMGIEEAVRAVVVHEPGTQLIDVNGNTKAFFQATTGGNSGRQSITSEYEIMRGDLVRILYGLTENRDNVRHLFGTTIESFTQDDESDPNGKVHVRFGDGRQEDFDLVVGAEGTASKTRAMILDSNSPDPRRFLGRYVAYFSVPSEPGDSDRFTLCHLPGGPVARIVCTRKDIPELTRVYMMFHGRKASVDRALKTGDLAGLKTALADLYEDGGWECKRFTEALRHASEADDLYCTPFEEVNLPQGAWSKGRVVLIGDAAHSSTANGYGTTWGLIGPYILAGEIGTLLKKDSSSPIAAVVQGARNYESAFRPIATVGHGGRHWSASLASPTSWIGIWILHMIARIVAYLKLEQMAGPSDETAKWELPEFPKLGKEWSEI
ncbi:uncharacterized protein A1O9_08301 [Exophiala aquamarina CBS 119918]|uniref:FAD-binding domain-containing protein n=1 Tax=Exophiala aquamarina CBS 119918 TaxID=1182545 RepID=A0A072P6Q0_9EURO|nr:uncharacterized protein A1O9_08301 [Exophiala aquamarina CBS 119918]KEF55551.1 hypothetical protein A1O9_08301 [Exophiala aquamarina CBS 119918]